MAAGHEANLWQMHTAAMLSSAVGLAQGSWGPATPTPAACRKLLAMALAEHSWYEAATLALALEPALPEEAQAGLTAAFSIARPAQQAGVPMQPGAPSTQIDDQLDLTNSRQAQSVEDAAQLAGLLQRQVCVVMNLTLGFIHV